MKKSAATFLLWVVLGTLVSIAQSTCQTPLSESGFAKLHTQIATKTSDANKLQMARLQIPQNCYNVDQIRRMMVLCIADEAKLEIAKLAYLRCTNPTDYNELDVLFMNEESGLALQEYIAGIKSQPAQKPKPQNSTPPAIPKPSATAGKCGSPVSETFFNTELAKIKLKTAESAKAELAKQLMMDYCLTSKQIKQLVALPAFEFRRLELAKWGYAYVFDPASYTEVNQSLQSGSSIRELREYMAKNAR